MASIFKRGGKKAKGYYYASWYDHNGRRKSKCTRTTDRSAAERIARKLEADVCLRKSGVVDTRIEGFAVEAKRPLAEHLEDFRAELDARQDSEKHVRMTCRHIEWIVDQSRASNLTDLTSAVVMRAIGALRNEGKSLRTCNAYLQSVTAFTRWLWTEKRTPDDALVGLKSFNEATDRRHVRRELTFDEISYLIPWVEGYTTQNHNLTGPHRAMAYRVALGTGFRANELRSLTPESFDLDNDPPTITVDAGNSKRRRLDVQPIRRDLAELLRPWLATKPRGERVFGKLPEATARMLRSDLSAARCHWIDAATDPIERQRREDSDFLRYHDRDGRVADFHSTRHTYISDIVAGNASVKVAQELARHSTSRLTVDRYAHARLHDVASALDALPAVVGGDPSMPATLEATGTDDVATPDPKRAAQLAQRQAQQSTRVSVQNNATACDLPAKTPPGEPSPKTLKITGSSEKKPPSEGGREKRRRPDSNRRWRICNPLP